MTMTHHRFNRLSGIILASASLATLAVLQGCATPPQAIPMSPDDRAALKQEPVIHVVHGASPALQITTPASVAGGGLITAATGSTELPSGAELERTYSLQDAAGELGEKLVQKLRNEGSMRNLHVEPALPQLPADLPAASYRGKYPSGLVLEVTVPHHSAWYGAVSWRTYKYGMSAKAQLIRVADAKVIWSDTCVTNNGDDYELNISDFQANNGARLKQVFHLATDQCSQALAQNLLSNLQ